MISTDNPPHNPDWQEVISIIPIGVDGRMVATTPVGTIEYSRRDSADIADMFITLAARIRNGE
jgi:hypothetical protein